MKTCSVCNATVFDDMDVCYGCMHRFDEKDGSVSFTIPVRAQDCGAATGGQADAALPETKCASEDGGDMTWKLRIELQRGGVTARTWVMDLFAKEPTSKRS